jgi:hypothetical protein
MRASPSGRAAGLRVGQGGGLAVVKGAMVIMAAAQTVQVRAETRGAVPEDAVSFAVHRVSSLLRVASEPVLFARVKLTMAAPPPDPAGPCGAELGSGPGRPAGTRAR